MPAALHQDPGRRKVRAWRVSHQGLRDVLSLNEQFANGKGRGVDRTAYRIAHVPGPMGEPPTRL
jgi:hypothetical protein